MFSFEPGLYEAEGQPSLVVTYGGELQDDPNHTGPWIQWRFAHHDRVTSTLWCVFGGMLNQGKYKLTEALASEGFKWTD
jgi:hypothetical protein